MSEIFEAHAIAARRTFLMQSAAGASALAAFLLPHGARGQVPLPDPAGGGPPFAERRVTRDGHRIYSREYPGKNPAFVLLHGFPDNLHIYDQLAPWLAAAGRRVITFDFLGFGESDKPKGLAYNFSQQLADLAAVVDAFQLNTFVPVPHDASGPAAINYSLDHPSRISSLVLLNTFYHESTTTHFPELITLFSEPQLRPLAMSYLSDPVKLQDLLQFQNRLFLVRASTAQKEIFDRVLQPVINANFQGGAGPAFVQMTADLRHNVKQNTNRLARLQQFHPPVHALFGTQDPYLDDSVGREFATRFKHGNFQGLAAGHWPQIDAPLELAKMMLACA